MTAASRILEGFTSIYNATAVEQLLAAGAIIIGGKTVMSLLWAAATKILPLAKYLMLLITAAYRAARLVARQ